MNKKPGYSFFYFLEHRPSEGWLIIFTIVSFLSGPISDLQNIREVIKFIKNKNKSIFKIISFFFYFCIRSLLGYFLLSNTYIKYQNSKNNYYFYVYNVLGVGRNIIDIFFIFTLIVSVLRKEKDFKYIDDIDYNNINSEKKNPLKIFLFFFFNSFSNNDRKIKRPKMGIEKQKRNRKDNRFN